jgi:hypothetical protein
MPDALQVLLARMGQQLSPSDMIQNMLGRMPPQDEVIPAPNRQYNVYSSEEDQRQSNLPINTAPIYGQRFPRTGDELIYQPRPEFTPTYPSTITTPTGPADVAFADIRNRRTLNKEITRDRRGEDTVLPSWIDPSPVPLTPADTVRNLGFR